jgi:hypothetical protein
MKKLQNGKIGHECMQFTSEPMTPDGSVNSGGCYVFAAEPA